MSRCPRRGSAGARLLGLWVRIPQGHGFFTLVSVVCCGVEVSASGWSLVQRRVSERDHESSIMRRPWSTGDCCALVKISKWKITCKKIPPFLNILSP